MNISKEYTVYFEHKKVINLPPNFVKKTIFVQHKNKKTQKLAYLNLSHKFCGYGKMPVYNSYRSFLYLQHCHITLFYRTRSFAGDPDKLFLNP